MRSFDLHRCTSGPRKGSAGGFTLIELMMTLVILGVLMSIALPSYRQFQASTQVKNATNDLVSMLTFARSEAIKRNANVALELGVNGWTVAVPNAATGTLLLQREAFSGVVMTCKTGPGCPAAGVSWPAGGISYSNSGRITAAATPSPSIDLSSTADLSDTSALRRCLSLDLSGMPRTAKAVCP